MKKRELSDDISKFAPKVAQPIMVNYFLFSLSVLNKKELKAYECLKSYNQFASGWVNELIAKLFLNYLLYFILHSTVRVTNEVHCVYCFS